MINVTPWLNYRPLRSDYKVIILHATAGRSVSGAISALRARRLSYHYIIDKDGTVYKCVPMTNPPTSMALHCGLSRGPFGPGVNAYSIGIAFVNENNGIDPYTKAQIDAAEALCLELKNTYKTISFISTHYAISPGRKTDPKNFPIQSFAEKVGLPVWP